MKGTADDLSVTEAANSEPSARRIVESFVSALARLDLDGALSLVHDQVRWVNYPFTTARDKPQFDKALRAMFRRAERFEVHYLDIHERGAGIVYNDRVDIFEGGGLSLTLRIRSQFRVRDGRITEWVDRFSWVDLTAAITRSLPRMIRQRLGK